MDAVTGTRGSASTSTAASSATDVVPGAIEHTGIGGGIGSAGPGEVVEDSVGEVKSTVRAARALKLIEMSAAPPSNSFFLTLSTIWAVVVFPP